MHSTNENLLTTGSLDFGSFYYGHCCGTPYERNEAWLAFFGNIANRIVSEIAPKTVLDAGCAKGFLVEMLRSKGADAYGADISQYAIESSHEDVKPYLKAQNLVEDLGRFFDLIITIEVVEHMNVRDAEVAIANLCAHTNDIIFSSSPFDYEEPTHINVHPNHYWAQLFARNGFFRDVDYDASYITPWTVRFRRRPFSLNEEALSHLASYERKFWELQQSSLGARKYSRELQNKLLALEAQSSEFYQRLQEAEQRVQETSQKLLETEQDLQMCIAQRNELTECLSISKQELHSNSQKLETSEARLSQMAADFEALQFSLHQILSGRWWRLRAAIIRLFDLFRSKAN